MRRDSKTGRQTKMTEFFASCKSRFSSEPQLLKRSKTESQVSAWAALPHDLLLSVAQCLGIRDIFYSLGSVCRGWKDAVRALPLASPGHFSRLSSTPHAGGNCTLQEFLFVLSARSAGLERFRDTLTVLGVRRQAEARHFWKVTRFFLETDTTHVAYRRLKLKHRSVYGDLLIAPSALAIVCQRSSVSLIELHLENIAYWSDELTSAVAACQGLETLSVSHSAADDAVMERVAAGLRKVIARGCTRLTQRSINAIGRLRDVKEVDFSDSFDGEVVSLQPFATLALTHLILDGLTMSLDYLGACQSLEVLSLERVVGLTDSRLFALSQSLRGLRKLNIRANNVSEDAVFTAVVSHLCTLEVLLAPEHVLSERVSEVIRSRTD